MRIDSKQDLKKARITLQGELKAPYYENDWGHSTRLALDVVARGLERLREKVGLSAQATVTLAKVTPVGYANESREWLVVELSDNDSFYKNESDWADVVINTAVILVDILNVSRKGRIATIEVGGRCYVGTAESGDEL